MTDNIFDKLAEKQTDRKDIYDGKILHVVLDNVLLPNGNTTKREVVLHNGAVCIVPITSDNKIIMERQFRYPFNEVIWEIPAGKIDKGETDPIGAAMRELREETGYVAKELIPIGEYYSSPAILSEKIYMYAAIDLCKGEQELDEDEFLDVERVPLEKLYSMVMAGEIADAKTQICVLKVASLKKI
jgi:ADP-ribose pyrophosphatase